MQPLSVGVLVRATVSLVLGGAVGAVGTVMHRSLSPVGLVLSLVLVLASGVALRAWSGLSALLGFAGGVFLVVQILSQQGPGGDVLITAEGALGWVWVAGALVAVGTAAFVPRSWFREQARSRECEPGSAPS